ncbi:MAG: efflux RND transporter permease subunit, partial [Chthoniobacterales bacterium]|nr:efflux RND transporter permease subunit [Chthoniobacterales bacterium]
MIAGLIAWSLRNRFLVACAFLLTVAYGIIALRQAPVDAIPDLSENQVIVFADWPGRSPQEIEDQVTYPLSTNLQGLAGVREVRGISMFGFSLLTVIFEDSLDNYFARTRVLERLNFLGDTLPAGVIPRLGPDATGLGWVYQYYLDTADHDGGDIDLGKLRSIQDYFIRYQLSSVPGVAEVASIGGFVRQYQVAVSSDKMRAAQVSLQEVMAALADSNLNVGGKVIEENGQEFVVRGIGLVASVGDLESVVVKTVDGVPVYLRDLARVSIGGEFRRGALDVDGREVVGGIVIMRTGENAMAVIRGIKDKIAALQPSLPAGVTIKPFYDRSGLIERTIDTLRGALIEEVILVTLAHILFLWHFRSVLIVTIPLPASILISFILMQQFGITSNIMSLAGIAIAIGVLVDAAIVITENVIRHCEQATEKKGSPLTAAETLRITGEASTQVGRPVFFAMAIIILAFLPVFALTGQEGKLFHPLAYTKTFAMVAATLLAVTIVPVLCSWLVRGPFRPEGENWIMRPLLGLYRPALDWSLAHGRIILGVAVLLLTGALFLALGLPRPVGDWLHRQNLPGLARLAGGMGSEFMPPLNEGSLLFMPVLLPSTSLTEVKRIMAWQDRVMLQVPEVESAAGKLGRAESPTDPAPVEMIETTIMLKPPDQWRAGMTREKLVAELTEKLSKVPGYVPGFLQPIENRILMLSTGIRAQVGVKVLGNDLSVLQRKVYEIEKVLRTVRGAVGVAPSRVQAKPYLEIIPDRVLLARHGLSLRDVLDYVEAGIGGVNVTTTIEGRERFPVQVRLERGERDEIDSLSRILVAGRDGAYVPLGQLATIRRNIGPSEIQSEDGLLKLFVQANVQGRDLGSFVAEAQRRIAAEVPPEPGVTIVWSGQYENQLRARKTLEAVIPAVLLIIFLMLYVTFRSALEASHVILAVPFALTGGVFLQWL